MNLNPVTTSYAAPTTFLADGAHYAVIPGGVTIDYTTVATGADGTRKMKAGALLGKITGSGKFGPYGSGLSDGRQTCVGMLFQVETFDCTLGDELASVLIHGIVKEACLGDGVPSATAKGHMKGILFV
jgi:hypothetical protein